MTYASQLIDDELTELGVSMPAAAASADEPLASVNPAPMNNVVAMPKAKPTTAKTYAFDYSGVSDAVAKEAEATAKRIRNRLKAHTIDNGKELLVIKKGLGHGKFGMWLEFHFGWKERTAQNYMNSAAVFGSTPQIIDFLPLSTIYKLAAPSTPDALRQAVIEQIKRGEKPDPKHIEKEIVAAKNLASQKPIAAETTDADSAPKSPPISAPNDASGSNDEATAIAVPATTSADKTAPHSPPLPLQELRARKIVEFFQRRFGDKFQSLRDAILETEWAALKKALQDA